MWIKKLNFLQLTLKKKRMENIMDVINYSLYRCLIRYLSPYHKIFENSYIEIKTLLSDAIGLLSSFSNMLKRLTEIDFRVSVAIGTKKKRQWKDVPYENMYLTKLLCRMKRILQLREVDNEMRTLLSFSSKKAEFEAKHSFQVSIFICLILK